MPATKVMVVLVLVLAVVSAADSKNKTAKAGNNVAGASLAAKARLPVVNATVNGTESKNSTLKSTITKRSLAIDKSQGKSELMSIWWRIPVAIWQFISMVLLNPLFESIRRLLALVGLSDQTIPTLPLTPATLQLLGSTPSTLPPMPVGFTASVQQPTP